MAAVEPLINYPESPMDEGEVFPCKGCGEILEEGKAFELAGNRWHIDCFRCNTCQTLLDSDANLLLLGDGSLICNNCTYSCNACGNKIEDLAILTGDQAFCAACFRCRNCKRKIENLRYARTSQGIFCMRCHESLMERRRKKSRSKQPQLGAGPVPAVDKSLPALPPNASLPLGGGDGQNDGERSPQSLHHPRFNPSRAGSGRDASPYDESRKENLTLPASTYGQRVSSISSLSPSEHDDDRNGFLPMAFDPNPPMGHQTQNTERHFYEKRRTSNNHRDILKEANGSRSTSSDREGVYRAASPNVAAERQQTISRNKDNGDSYLSSSQADYDPRPQPQQTAASTNTIASLESFKLQDAPRARKSSVRGDKADQRQQGYETPYNQRSKPNDDVTGSSPPTKEAPSPDINPFDDPKLYESTRHPARGDSLTASGRKPVVTIPDRSASEAAASGATLKVHMRSESEASNGALPRMSSPTSRVNGKSMDAQQHGGIDIPPRSAGRTTAPNKTSAGADFVAPRVPPPRPANGHSGRNESVASITSNDPASPGKGHFHKPSLGEGFSMDEEMSRIIGRQDSTARESSPSVLRRVSNAVRHGRSFSDRAPSISQRTPTGQHVEISSPLSANSSLSPSATDEVSILKAHLKRSQQRIAELESEKLGLQERMNESGDLRQVNTELREKRSTMAFLDTQREMVVRELEVMTEHLSKAKDMGQPLDLSVLKSDILQDFAHSLHQLKESLGAQIEDLVHKRNELTDEIANLIQVKDKGLQEFESLSSKNNQLNDMNHQLVHSIQDMYKANRLPNGSSMHDLRSGSGSVPSVDLSSLASLNHDQDTEQVRLVNAPQVVNIRKGGQAKKFNWKGGREAAKNMTRGLKGAFTVKDGQYDMNGMPISHPQARSGAGGELGGLKISAPTDATRTGGLTFFSQKNGTKGNQLGMSLKSSSSSNLLGVDPSTLFGSDLAARCEYERRVLPAIVTRCIEEVEHRGLDVEGIYRKSGGSGQVKQVQNGFEKDGNLDISDPDLDIHSVTSCLKQYFRKLPNPLITFDVYDSVLEAVQLPEDSRGVAMKAALGNLPPCHKDVLEFLTGHLARIVDNERVNLMTPLNLSVVFAPTIMRPASIEREMTDMQIQRDVVRALLEHRAMIFD